MVSQVVLSGTIMHEHMETETLIARVRTTFPKLECSAWDFVIPLGDCRAEFFCLSTQTIDFRIVPSESGWGHVGSSRVIPVIEILVRSTDALWEGLRSSLRVGHLGKRPRLTDCAIVDDSSKASLLIRDQVSPLRSLGAKISYAFSFIFCAAAIALVIWQLHTKQSADVRAANILAITVPLGVAAVASPIPILITWREWRAFTWRYRRIRQR